MNSHELKSLTDVKNLKEWLLNIREKHYIELKTASELPRAFWESYSSFSNTSGGFVILGVKEAQPQNVIVGVSNVDKLLRSLWDQLSNTSKVNYRNISNDDVNIYEIEGHSVVIVYVPEAPERKKPVYINGKIEETYIRTGDGDRKATFEELQSLLRNASSGQDTLIAKHFTINDLDAESLALFKSMVHSRFPKKDYVSMTDALFLTEIGACSHDRVSGELKIKKGTLLFLGKSNSIKELYPHYHVDYFDRRGNSPRWIDRVTDDELGNDEMNLFRFYLQVDAKLRALSLSSFALDEKNRRGPVPDFDETLRECLVNMLAHADYDLGLPTTRIDVKDGFFSFKNPGKMLVSPNQFVIGGDSRPRNEIIMKMFRLIGASERQGMGGPMIFKSAESNQFRRPEIETNLERTELRVWNIDLASSYPELSEDEKNVLRVVIKANSALSINNIQESTSLTDYKIRKIIVPKLLTLNLIQKHGSGRATKYHVSVTSEAFFTKLQLIMDKLGEVIKR